MCFSRVFYARRKHNYSQSEKSKTVKTSLNHTLHSLFSPLISLFSLNSTLSSHLDFAAHIHVIFAPFSIHIN